MCSEVDRGHKRASTLRLAELQIFVSNLRRSRDFYHGLLGLPVLQESPSWLVLDLDGLELVLMSGAEPAPHQADYGRERGTVICLATADINAEYLRLVEARVRFLTPVEQVPQGRYAAFEDPDGNLLELIQPGAPS